MYTALNIHSSFTWLDRGIIELPPAIAVPPGCPRRDAEYALAFTARFNEAWRARFGGVFDVYFIGSITAFLERNGRSPDQSVRDIRVADHVIAAAIEAALRSQR